MANPYNPTHGPPLVSVPAAEAEQRSVGVLTGLIVVAAAVSVAYQQHLYPWFMMSYGVDVADVVSILQRPVAALIALGCCPVPLRLGTRRVLVRSAISFGVMLVAWFAMNGIVPISGIHTRMHVPWILRVWTLFFFGFGIVGYACLWRVLSERLSPYVAPFGPVIMYFGCLLLSDKLSSGDTLVAIVIFLTLAAARVWAGSWLPCGCILVVMPLTITDVI